MKPTVPEVLPLLRDYLKKPRNNCGGSLHVIVDNGNDTPAAVAWCLDYVKRSGDQDAILILEKMVQMSRTQIKKLCAECWKGVR